MKARTARFATLACVAAAAAIPAGALAQGNEKIAWSDESPHRVRMIQAAPGVRLEVLDWGGTGAPMVFLAGGGNTAHVYDGFAPRFTSAFRVIGITRRGVGASAKPLSGYDSATLAADIVAILDTLQLKRATFVGHSFAAELGR